MPRRWRLILRYVPRYRRAVVLGFLALLLGNASLIAIPVVLRQGVRAIEKPPAGTIEPALVGRFALVALGLALAGGVFQFSKRYLLMGTSRRVETDLRRDLFAHIQRLPLRYLGIVRTGDLMSRVTQDLEAGRMAIGPAAMYLIDSSLSIVGALCVLFAINFDLTFVVLVPLAGICGGLFLLAPRIHRASRAVQDGLATISSRAQESYAGARVVKIFAIEDRESADMDRLGAAYVDANLRLARVRGMTVAWIGLMNATGLGVVLLVGGREVVAGTFDLSGLLLFNMYQSMLVWPMMSFGWVLSMVQRGAAGLDRIGEVMAEPTEVDVVPEPGEPIRGEIEVRDLSFAYDGEPVLEHVTFRLPAGATLGIVGPTGSGKSTLVSLLVRLHDPPPDTMLVDGRPVESLPLDTLRGAVAFVPQEPFLFSTTIRANVAFGRPDATADELVAAVRDAHLAGDLESFPKGIETVVGERGVTLSGGQKQRAALARALASDAPILVLDDALSAVDSETETAILANLRRHKEGRTAIVVAHRVSAVRDADWILHLRDGRVVEQGTHADLVARSGPYARLARAQELADEIERLA